jgi:hypothetical protein
MALHVPYLGRRSKGLHAFQEGFTMRKVFETQGSCSLDTAVVDVTKMILERIRSQEIVERVTIARAYMELARLYPDVVKYRDEMSRSLRKLADVTASHGQARLARSAMLLAEKVSPAVLPPMQQRDMTTWGFRHTHVR